MRDVVIISESKQIFLSFSTVLSHLPAHFSYGGDLDEAESQLRSEKPDFVFFAVRKLTLLHNWIARFKNLKQNIPFICLTSHLDWEKRELLWMAGASEVIELPKLQKEFLQIIENILISKESSVKRESDFSGSLNVLSVIDLIQTFEDGKKNGIVEIKFNNKSGELHFNKGHIVNARFEDKDPMDSVRAMVTWTSGNFYVKLNNIKHNERIKMDNRQVIKECQHHLVARARKIKSLPEPEEIYYAAPLLDYEELGHQTRRNLLFFKDGSTLNTFIENDMDCSIRLLDDLEQWIEQKWLLKRDEYKEQLYTLKKRENTSAVKKVFEKIFSREPEKTAQVNPTVANKKPVEKEIIDRGNKKEFLFNNKELLTEFQEILENS